MINKSDPRLLKIAAQNKAANSLMTKLKKAPGVLYAMKVGGMTPQTTGITLIFDTQQNADLFGTNHTLKEWTPEELSSWKSIHKDDPQPATYSIKKMDVFARVIKPPHSDLVKETDHYLLQVRRYFENDEHPPSWETRHKVEHSPNKEWDKQHPPEENAKALGEGWMQMIFVPEEEEAEDYDSPIPAKTEYRIIKVVTTQEVVDYQVRKYDDPFSCVSCKKPFHIKDLVNRRIKGKLGFSLACKPCGSQLEE